MNKRILSLGVPIIGVNACIRSYLSAVGLPQHFPAVLLISHGVNIAAIRLHMRQSNEPA